MPRLLPVEYEAEVVVGLEQLARDELQQFSVDIRAFEMRKGAIRFSYAGDPGRLRDLTLVQAVYRQLRFAVPRPKALLGHAHFQRLIDASFEVLSVPGNTFETVGIDAAGSESSVMLRLKAELAVALKLQPSEVDRGDLLFRIFPSSDAEGWDCLIRISARPLATRMWRVRNFAAALNATVAQAMVRLVTQHPGDVFVNLCCGSGSLLAERADYRLPASVLIGIDNDETTIQLAQMNLGVVSEQILLWLGDAQTSPLCAGSATALVADLPFGQKSGSHHENLQLYPRIMTEAARIAAPSALFAVLTHEIRLFESLIADSSDWQLTQVLPITLRGLHPRLYLLRRLG